MASEIADSVDADDDWLPEAVLGDIARREAELAAWIEVAGTPDPLWIRAVAALKAHADFDATADTALEVANADLAPPVAEPAMGDAAHRPPASPRRSPSRPSGRSRIGRPLRPAGRRTRHGRHSRSAARLAMPHAQPAAQLAAQQAGPAVGDALRPESSALPAATVDSAREPAIDLSPPQPPRPPATHRRPARRSNRRFPVYAILGALLGAAAAAVVLLLPHSGHATPQPSNGPTLTPRSSAPAPTTPKTAPPASSGKQSGPHQQRSTTTCASRSPR